jgi:hypothetical protein
VRGTFVSVYRDVVSSSALNTIAYCSSLHNLGAALDRPSKGYPDYGSRVVSEKSNDVRPRIELTANVEGE